MYKVHVSEFVCSSSQISSTEDLEIDFESLICTFHLSIHLKIVCITYTEIDTEKFSQCLKNEKRIGDLSQR